MSTKKFKPKTSLIRYCPIRKAHICIMSCDRVRNIWVYNVIKKLPYRQSESRTNYFHRLKKVLRRTVDGVVEY